MEKSGLHNECTWKLGAPDNEAKCPHFREKREHSAKIKDTILDCVGNTPMVRINNITKAEGIECEILAKCEFLNPCGSVKDRIGRRMVVAAEKSGTLKPGDIIVEPTSGNTGVGLAMAAAVKGYRMIITMKEMMSQEKSDALQGLGATVIRAPNHYPFDHKRSYIGVALQLAADLDNAHCFDQYSNVHNPMAHYEETAEEIWDQCSGRIDYVFLGAGTCGTLTGISRKLKEKDPNITIVGVDPEGSVMAEPASLNAQKGGIEVEGIGKDFIPRCLDKTHVDHWMKANGKRSYTMARRLLREEALMCGGSAGAPMQAAVEYIKEHKIGAGKRCVVLFPDNIRNYMTKHLNNDWMYEKGYITEKECADAAVSDLVPNNDWGQDKTVADLDLHEAEFIDADATVGEVRQLMLKAGYAQYPVKEKNGKITGVVTKTDLMNKLVKGAVQVTDPVRGMVHKELRHVSATTTLNELNRVLTRNRFVLVEKRYMVTTTDLLKLLGEPVGTTTPPAHAEQKSNRVEKEFGSPSTATSSPDQNLEDEDDDDNKKDGMSTKLAAAAIGGVGILATAAYVMMKQQN